MTISHIEPQDFARLFEIEQQAHLVPWSYGTLLNNQGERYLNLKLIEQGKIIAFAICYLVADEGNLFNIAVDPRFQGKGYGKKLLQALIEQLKPKGVSSIWLEVRESNLNAQKLYSSVGFNQVSVRKNYYPTTNPTKRENAVIMALSF